MPHDPKVIPIMRGRLVLVAERYGTPHVLVTTAVRELGYPARAFATAADVLLFLKLHRGGVQCLLADLGLPDMDGGELAQRALDSVPGLRVVLMAAPGPDGRRADAGLSGPAVSHQTGFPGCPRRVARAPNRPTSKGAGHPTIHGPAADAPTPSGSHQG
jgi:CheY-like chemotaxis protein